MKILFILPNIEFEKKIKKILDEANEQNHSFLDLIDLITEPNQILYNKIHAYFGIKYVDNSGVKIQKLENDLKQNSKYFSKFKKLKIWIIKIWTKKTKSTQVCFYLISPHFYNNFNNLYKDVIDISKYFSNITIFFKSNSSYKSFDQKKFGIPFNSLIFNPNKKLKEQILEFVNKTNF